MIQGAEMLGAFIRSLISYFLLGIVGILFAPVVIFFLLLPERFRYGNRALAYVGNAFYWLSLKCSLLPISFEGWEYLPQEEAVYVANHQSSLDIPLIGVLARGTPHVWLAWEELIRRSLILRAVLPRFAVLVDGSDKYKAMRSLIRLMNLTTNGYNSSIMIFPEGGRFIDGKVHEFFGGFVILAKKTGRPVVPVRIFGAHKAYSPGAFIIRWHKIRVVIGRPLSLKDGESDEAFKQRVYNWFLSQGEDAP